MELISGFLTDFQKHYTLVDVREHASKAREDNLAVKTISNFKSEMSEEKSRIPNPESQIER